MECILKRLGIIGAGSIARAHIDAARQAGFLVDSICGSKDSLRAREIASELQGLVSFSDLSSLLDTKPDAVVIAVNPTHSLEILIKCLDLGLPVLIEKPASTSSKSFSKLMAMDTSGVIVGYNRRHYSSVEQFKGELEKYRSGLVNIQIPELSWSKNPSYPQRRAALLENSVHIFDLANYLFGGIRIRDISKNHDEKSLGFSVASFETDSGFNGSVSIGFGVPDNSYIKFWTDGTSLELKPIEHFNKVGELRREVSKDFIQSTRYLPISEYNWNQSQSDLIAKPGFLRQYEEFYSLVAFNIKPNRSANINDAKLALEIAEKFIS
jgi:predicted dehydrogenase